MSKQIRIKAKITDNIADIRCLISHPMSTGLQLNQQTGKIMPELFVQELSVAVNDVIMILGDINSTVSKNPYFRFHVKATKGDKITVAWKDNKGNSATHTIRAT